MKINYFDTPYERRTKGNNFVNIISYVMGFSKPIKKVFKRIQKLEDPKYEHTPIESDIYNHQKDE